MCRGALLLLLGLPVIAATAPIPAPSEKDQIAKLWGTVVAPSEEDEFKLNGKALTIRTAGVPHRGLIEGERCKMARVTRTWSGDFEATVKVIDVTPPNKDSRHQDAWPWTRAGLFVRGGDSGIEFHLSQYNVKLNGVVQDKLTRVAYVDTWFPGGGAGSSLNMIDPGKSVYLRVTRKEKTVTISHSYDGKEWVAPRTPRPGLDFAGEVTIGVFVNHTNFQSVQATFSDFVIEQPAMNDKPK